MITLNNVSKVFRTQTVETLALNDINLHVEKGEFLSIMGPSGCGKSTLLNIMGLLDEPSDGDVNLDGERIEAYNTKSLARFRNEHLGFIFQSFHLINDLSVVDNVELPLLYRRTGGSERRRLALEALAHVGLSNRSTHFPNQLSGGQKQRVAIARAIVGRPNIILADEPTGNLDSRMGDEIMDILLKLNTDLGTTIVMVTHSDRDSHYAHRVINLFDGQIVTESQNKPMATTA